MAYLYLAMPDVEALRQLLSLWDRLQRGAGLPSGFAPWRDVFASLREIRPWGPADRLSDETIFRWREEIEDDPGEMRRIEVELWYRDRGEIRAAALRRVAEVVAEAGGALVHHVVMESGVIPPQQTSRPETLRQRPRHWHRYHVAGPEPAARRS